MMFRRKLLAVFALTIFLSVATVGWLVSSVSGNAFEQNENARTTALVGQFQREFNQQGEEVARRVGSIAASDQVSRLATSLNTTPGDFADFFDLAKSMAENHRLDFLELVTERGMIISSAQSPARFGYPEASFENLVAASDRGAFLKQEELPESAVLGLFAIGSARVGDHWVYVIGGLRLDKDFLSALDLPAGMRVLLYQTHGDHFSGDFLVDPARGDSSKPVENFSTLIGTVRESGKEATGTIHWSADAADDEVFHAIPLRGEGKAAPLLAVLLIGNSQRSYVELKRHIRASALLAAGGGVLMAVLLSSWVAARVTRPVVQLAHAAQEVAAGNWNTHVEVTGNDEVSQLAESFNRMTSELLTQKERLVQTERVAAWRELARRLAHELKNPLFPLQLTVENLVRARAASPEQFDEVFRESSATLLAEIANLKTIIGRFSDFSKMPHPQLQAADLNQILRRIEQLFQAQFQAQSSSPIICKLEFDENLPVIDADPELLHRALSNLVLNALDAMPAGGVLALRSKRGRGKVVVEVADTGSGLTPEECERIFTPYYTSKQHGTGLGLAIVQSVISDHGGSINVRSEPGRGTTFVIELPSDPDAVRAIAAAKSENQVG